MASTLKPNQPELLRTDADGIATLRLNRPKQFNSLSTSLLDALQNELDAIAAEESVRVVVLAGEGKAFCAGHDLKEMRANPRREYYEKLFDQCSRLMLSIRRLRQPVIASVHGIATAAGCQLVATCDLAVASSAARFAVSGINVGLFCSTPGVALSRNLAAKHAFEMLITGEFVDAEAALERGLVNRVVEPEQLDNAVHALSRTIAAKLPLAVDIGKRLFYRQLEMDIESAYAHAGEVMAANMMADDVCEGIDAFIEKRHPAWRNR